MNFLQWYGIGVTTIMLTLLIEAYRHSHRDMRVRNALSEVYQILIGRANILSTILLLLVSLFGPMLPVIFAYLIARDWYDGLTVDDDDNKEFPWTKD